MKGYVIKIAYETYFVYAVASNRKRWIGSNNNYKVYKKKAYALKRLHQLQEASTKWAAQPKITLEEIDV